MLNKYFFFFTVLLASATLSAGEDIKITPAAIPGKTKADFNGPTAGFGSSNVQTHLRIDVKDETKAIHFIRDNNDPFVITKTYELKHAEPYGLRSYLNAVINAKRVDKNAPSVTAVKFNDGRKFLIVSAEAYRFTPTEHGQSIDEIVAELDVPGMNASSGRPKFIYYPKISTAANLKKMLVDVGASGVDTEFDSGIDVLQVDGGLNALFVAAPFWSWKQISERLAFYDRPIPEIEFSYKIVEIFAENDDRIGLDFQNWKNNDGANLFSAGGRYRNNWSATFAGNVNNSRASKTEYFNFNPKWNTKYIDFLTSTGRAKVLTEGMLTAKNRKTSSISIGSGLFYDEVSSSVDAGNTNTLTSGFKGKKELPAEIAPVIKRGNKQLTKADNSFRFSLEIIDPVVTADSTVLTVKAENISLMGWKSSGEPRLNNSKVETSIQIGHNGKDFIIGGLRKYEVVRGVAGLPVLKDLPLLGWLFSTETESTKTSHVVIIAHAKYSTPFKVIPTTVRKNISKISDDIQKGMKSKVNNLGFQQWKIDEDK